MSIAVQHILGYEKLTPRTFDDALVNERTDNMSFSAAQLSAVSSAAVTPKAFRPSVRQTPRSRGALQVRNATLWSLSSKGKEIEITDTVGKKSICGVGGESATNQDKVAWCS